MRVINACKPPPREMKKCSLSKFCVSVECFWESSIYSMSDEIWHMPHLWWQIKNSDFPGKIRTKAQILHPLGSDSVCVRHYCIYHRQWPPSSTGLLTPELQFNEHGPNPVNVLRYLFHLLHRSLLLLSGKPVDRCWSKSCRHLDQDDPLFSSRLRPKQPLNILYCFSSTLTFHSSVTSHDEFLVKEL